MVTDRIMSVILSVAKEHGWSRVESCVRHPECSEGSRLWENTITFTSPQTSIIRFCTRGLLITSNDGCMNTQISSRMGLPRNIM